MSRQRPTPPTDTRAPVAGFSIIISFCGIAFWLPQIVKSVSGLSNAAATLMSALPYLAASVGMVLLARHSDRTGERRRHVAVSAVAGAAGLIAGALLQVGRGSRRANRCPE
jgi:ACS family tartrate transporter-like MFS transporter